MPSSVIVSGQQLGRIKPLFLKQYLSLPSEFFNQERAITLKDLLTHIIDHETNTLRVRQQDGMLTHVLTTLELAKGRRQGKIDMGGKDVIQEIETEVLVKNALLAFEDGLYFVIIDDNQCEDLEETINLKLNSQLLFLRLVPLVRG